MNVSTGASKRESRSTLFGRLQDFERPLKRFASFGPLRRSFLPPPRLVFPIADWDRDSDDHLPRFGSLLVPFGALLAPFLAPFGINLPVKIDGFRGALPLRTSWRPLGASLSALGTDS